MLGQELRIRVDEASDADRRAGRAVGDALSVHPFTRHGVQLAVAGVFGLVGGLAHAGAPRAALPTIAPRIRSAPARKKSELLKRPLRMPARGPRHSVCAMSVIMNRA